MRKDIILSQALNVLDDVDTYIFAKDKKGKYIYCNDTFAKVTGCDSKESVIGKTDYDLIWRAQGDFFRSGDFETMSGRPLVRAPECQIQPNNRVASIFTSKSIIKDSAGKIAGIVGFYIENAANDTISKIEYDQNNDSYIISDHLSLSQLELSLLQRLLLGYNERKIRDDLKINRWFYLSLKKSIRTKLQSQSDNDLLEISTQRGITHLVFQHDLWCCT